MVNGRALAVFAAYGRREDIALPRRMNIGCMWLTQPHGALTMPATLSLTFVAENGCPLDVPTDQHHLGYSPIVQVLLEGDMHQGKELKWPTVEGGPAGRR